MKKILFSLLMVALFLSCSKDENGDGNNIDQGTINLAEEFYPVYGSVLYPLSSVNLVVSSTDTSLNCQELFLMNSDTLGVTSETINSCIEANKNKFTFQQDKLLSGGLKLVSWEELTQSESAIDILQKYGANGMYTFGRPVLYNDGQNAIFQLSYFCGGLCGNGAIIIAQKNNEVWGVKHYLVTWISK